MVITPHNCIASKRQHPRGRPPRGCRTIINKRKVRALYQKTCYPQLFIPGSFRYIFKQLRPTGITTTVLLWLLSTQNSPHDIFHAKQIFNQTDLYW